MARENFIDLYKALFAIGLEAHYRCFSAELLTNFRKDNVILSKLFDVAR